jgi:hypothetical protein
VQLEGASVQLDVSKVINRSQVALDVDELAFDRSLATDLGQAVPGDALVVLGPLPASAAELVRRE